MTVARLDRRSRASEIPDFDFDFEFVLIVSAAALVRLHGGEFGLVGTGFRSVLVAVRAGRRGRGRPKGAVPEVR